MGLASGHVAVTSAVTAKVTAQWEVVRSGRISVCCEHCLPAREIFSQQRIDRRPTGPAGRALGLPSVKRTAAQELANYGTATGHITEVSAQISWLRMPRAYWTDTAVASRRARIGERCSSLSNIASRMRSTASGDSVRDARSSHLLPATLAWLRRFRRDAMCVA